VDWLFLLALGLALFLARDVLLLGALRRGAALKATLAYTAVYLAVFAALGTTADFVSRDQALELLRDSRLWIPAVVLHIALGFTVVMARRRNAPDRALWLVLVPAPVFLYCAGGLCWLALSNGVATGASTAGAVLGCLWIVLTTALSSWSGRPGGTGATAENGEISASARDSESRINESNTQAVLDFAAAANLSVILLLPLNSFSPQSALAETPFRWGTTLMALAATAGLVGASFLYHRLRRDP
jgi:hypothetical protein